MPDRRGVESLDGSKEAKSAWQNRGLTAAAAEEQVEVLQRPEEMTRHPIQVPYGGPLVTAWRAPDASQPQQQEQYIGC